MPDHVQLPGNTPHVLHARQDGTQHVRQMQRYATMRYHTAPGAAGMLHRKGNSQ